MTLFIFPISNRAALGDFLQSHLPGHPSYLRWSSCPSRRAPQSLSRLWVPFLPPLGCGGSWGGALGTLVLGIPKYSHPPAHALLSILPCLDAGPTEELSKATRLFTSPRTRARGRVGREGVEEGVTSGFAGAESYG